MSEKQILQEENKALHIGVVMQRFKGFIDEYERKITQEKYLLKTLNPIDSCDDVLYELQITRDALVKCYEKVFNGV